MNWYSKLIHHKKELRIAVYFEKNERLMQRIKQFEGATWSQSKKVWHLPDNQSNRIHFRIPEAYLSLPSAEGIAAIHKFNYWLASKRYSPSTIKTYSEALKSFLIFHRELSISEITNEDVIKYNNEYILKNNISSSYQNQIVNAVKLFFSTIENKKMEIESIHRPKREKILPNVLSKEEIKLILNAHFNIKHKTMLSLIYSCGLRRGELLNLKLEDIDSKRNIIMIRQAKGKKDRIATLSPKILEMLRSYYTCYKPKVWLFEGRFANEPYDARSLSNVLKQALVKSNIQKPVSFVNSIT